MKLQAVFFDADSVVTKDAKVRQGMIELLKKLKKKKLKLVLVFNPLFPGRCAFRGLGVLSLFDLKIWEHRFKNFNVLALCDIFSSFNGAVIPAGSVYISQDFEDRIKTAQKIGMWGIWINRTRKKREMVFCWEARKTDDILPIIEEFLEK